MMVEKKYFCNLCRDEIKPEGTNRSNTGTGFEWYGSPYTTRFKLTGLGNSENHICWKCIAAVGEHDMTLRKDKA